MRLSAAADSRISAANFVGDCADLRAASTISANNSFEITSLTRTLLICAEF